ncbi:hypothetical protein K504DRAFT_199863 [Pleomassaria siparia CBS 279.74]|uniref:Uncharacterized protein n=1 Tax=Pleomassaria siparia CBS 279.74 TaxID=1314801 RepID=A0A6G1KIQ6_9PLEO|nr:hypothetical protein K504DRAFT_199863 [Pleomassaria siparia CBS 279.74]
MSRQILLNLLSIWVLGLFFFHDMCGGLHGRFRQFRHDRFPAVFGCGPLNHPKPTCIRLHSVKVSDAFETPFQLMVLFKGEAKTNGSCTSPYTFLSLFPHMYLYARFRMA